MLRSLLGRSLICFLFGLMRLNFSSSSFRCFGNHSMNPWSFFLDLPKTIPISGITKIGGFRLMGNDFNIFKGFCYLVCRSRAKSLLWAYIRYSFNQVVRFRRAFLSRCTVASFRAWDDRTDITNDFTYSHFSFSLKGIDHTNAKWMRIKNTRVDIIKNSWIW